MSPEAGGGRHGAGLPTWALAAASGLLFYLAYPPVGFWPLSLAGAALLVAAVLRCGSWSGAAAAAALAKTVFVAPVSWYLWGVAPAVLVLFALNYGLVWAGYGLLLHALRRRAPAAALAASPAAWVLFDWLAPRLHFLPSELAGWHTALGDSPFLELAPVLGVYGTTYWAASLAAVPLLWLAARRDEPDARPAALAVAAGAAVPALVLALLFPGRAGKPAGLRAAVVGVGAGDGGAAEAGFEDESRPWDLARRERFLAFARGRLGRILPRLGNAELALLPEDFIDVDLERDRSKEAFERWGLETNGALIEAYREFARRAGAAAAVGLTTQRGGRRYSSVLLLSPSGEVAGLSDKSRLTAGSEYWPLPFLQYWRLFAAASGRFVAFGDQYSAGRESCPLLSLGRWSFGAPICLEGQIPLLALRWKRKGADFLALPSNAHWFDGDPAPYNGQLLLLLRMSARAYALPILLTGRLGYFGVVDGRGRAEVASGFAPGFEDGVGLHSLPIPSGRSTTASRCGEYFLAWSAAMVLTLPALLRGR